MVDWANAGGPNECKHGFAEGITCTRCCAEYNARELSLDSLEDGLLWTSTHVGAPFSEVRTKAARELRALQSLRRQAVSDAEFIAAGYDPEDEPPIVKGALDAQAEAECEVFRLRAQVGVLEIELQRLKAEVTHLRLSCRE